MSVAELSSGATFGLTEVDARDGFEEDGAGARRFGGDCGDGGALQVGGVGAGGGGVALARRESGVFGAQRPSRPEGAPRELRPGSRAAQAAARAGDPEARGSAVAELESEAVKMDIMMLLDIDKVPSLRREFEAKQGGLTKSEFVHLMTKYLKRAPGLASAGGAVQLQLVSDLCELFAQVDINGDGTMEWDEFTSYIVDTGNQARDNEPNCIQTYMASRWRDEYKHEGAVTRVYWFGAMNRFATCAARSGRLDLWHASPPSQDRSIRVPEPATVLCAAHLAGRGLVAVATTALCVQLFDESSGRLAHSWPCDTSQGCLEWHAPSGTLFSAGVNGVVSGWDVDARGEAPRHQMGGVVQLPGGQLGLAPGSHTDMVLALLAIDSLESIASAGMDRTIRLWDVATGRHKKTLVGHEKGVRSLAYSADYRFMVSAGFDYDAFVWNPYVEHLILRLHGHNAPLCRVEMVPDTPQIVTCDASGVLKVWDIRNFACVQTMAVEDAAAASGEGRLVGSGTSGGAGTGASVGGALTHLHHPRGSAHNQLCEGDLMGGGVVNDFCCAVTSKALVAGGSHGLVLFEYERLQHPERTDDLPVFAALFNSVTTTLLSASGRELKQWCARSGKLLTRFRGVYDGAELSAVCLDNRERKIIVGDHAGRIRVFDYLNGSLMKQFAYPERAHESEVSCLIYCNTHKVVISAGWDDAVMVHDEMEAEEGVLLRKMVGGHRGSDITALAYSRRLSLIASGAASAQAPIVLWGFEFGRVEAVLDPSANDPTMAAAAAAAAAAAMAGAAQRTQQQHRQQHKPQAARAITALLFLDETFPGLVSAEDGGGVVVWAVRPAHEWRNRALVRFINRSPSGEATTVSALCADQARNRLYTGDERGWVKVWDLEPLARSITSRSEPFKPVECENPRRKIAVDVAKQDAARFSLAAASATSQGPTGIKPAVELDSAADAGASAGAGVSAGAGATAGSALHGQHGSFRKARSSTAAVAATPPVLSAQPAVVFKAALVALECSWQAHNEAVQSIQLVLDDERSCLITAALDGVVRVFDLAGTPLGSLMQGESLAGKAWRVKTDIQARRAAQRKQAEDVLSNISGQIQDTPGNMCPAGAATGGDNAEERKDDAEDEEQDPLGALHDSERRVVTGSEPVYTRRTPKLAPIDPTRAGRGLSNSLKGKRFRSTLYTAHLGTSSH